MPTPGHDMPHPGWDCGHDEDHDLASAMRKILTTEGTRWEESHMWHDLEGGVLTLDGAIELTPDEEAAIRRVLEEGK